MTDREIAESLVADLTEHWGDCPAPPDATDISADEWEIDAEMDEFERVFWGEKS